MRKNENAQAYLGKEVGDIFFPPLVGGEGAGGVGSKGVYKQAPPPGVYFLCRPGAAAP